jgi:hypothetical protein
MLVAFIQKTWFLWWTFAIVVILRWFHVQSAPARQKVADSRLRHENQAPVGPAQWAS